jgi:hypothetical protein
MLQDFKELGLRALRTCILLPRMGGVDDLVVIVE